MGYWSSTYAIIKLIQFLWYVINVFSKYSRVIPSTDKKVIKITNTFQNFSDESNRKPTIIWVDKGSEFYNRLIQPRLQNNDIDIYSAHNEENLVVAKKFITTLRNKVHKYNIYYNKILWYVLKNII